jgi:hypothetical protein
MEDVVYQDDVSVDKNEIKNKCKQLLLLDNKKKQLKSEKKILENANKMYELDIQKLMTKIGIDRIEYKDVVFEIKTTKKKQALSKKYIETKCLEFFNGNKNNTDLFVNHLYDKSNRYEGQKKIIKKQIIKDYE